MPRALTVVSADERTRRNVRYLIASIILLPAGWIYGLGENADSTTVPVGLACIALMLGGVVWLYRRAGADAARTDQAAQQLGYNVVTGDIRSGLADWPANGFPTLERERWNFQNAFDHRDDGVRIFNAISGGSNHTFYLFGATIHMPRARFPEFLIGPVRTGLFNKSAASPSVFTFDPAFAADHEIVTGDVQRLQRRLGRAFVESWRDMPGWRIEGSGDRILVTRDSIVDVDTLPAVTAQLGTLIAAIRRDLAAG
jgi:rhodanese-related sulfurtransferase